MAKEDDSYVSQLEAYLKQVKADVKSVKLLIAQEKRNIKHSEGLVKFRESQLISMDVDITYAKEQIKRAKN